MSRKINILMVLAVVLTTNTVFAKKSVYIISKHSDPSKAHAYRIDGNEVTLQDVIDINSYNPGIGAVANAVWPEKELMFVTYEYSNRIVWSSTKTMRKVGEYDTEVSNLAGIVVDTEKELIYAIWRNREDLYVYSFDETNNTLVLEDQYDLQTSTTSIDGFGLALDEENDRLYVTNGTETVHYYDTDTWARIDDDIDIVVDDNNRPAVGIAVDPVRGYMYTGGLYGTGGYHNYLVRTELSSPHDSNEILIVNDSNVGKPAIGIAVDEETGYVYVTTDADDFRVYDSNLTLLNVSDTDIDGPAGVAVGGFYKHTYFDIVKDNNDPGDACVEPFMSLAGNYLDFDICWDANGYAESNVLVVDYLPTECEYYSSEPNGDYNLVDHTVTWNLEDIAANDSNCIFLRTKVYGWARPCGSFTNLVTMEGDNYFNDDVEDCNVCSYSLKRIYVDKDANGYNSGRSWIDAYRLLQDALDSARVCANSVTEIWVAEGTYKPVWDVNIMTQEESFELIDDVGVFGHFGGYERSVGERDFSDSNNVTILDGQIGDDVPDEKVDNVVNADGIVGATVDGFTIRGGYDYGVYLTNEANIGIVNCKMEDNGVSGISLFNNSYADIHNCIFRDTGLYGVYSIGSESVISYCVFDGNDDYAVLSGLKIEDSNDEVKYCVFKNYYDKGIYDSASDSLTVKDCYFENNYYGIELVHVTANVTNSCIKNSGYNGIKANSSELTVDHSLIESSGVYGIHLVNGSELELTRSVVRYNWEVGIWLDHNWATNITNCWIHNNGDYYLYNGAGIYLKNMSEVAEIRNNTIYGNETYGIEGSSSGDDPNILNCIIYGNGDGDLDRGSGSFNTVNYCNLQSDPGGIGNIFSDPCFMNILSDANDLHIDGDSNCIDAGILDANYGDETDIDGEVRIEYGRVDIGADEYYWSAADFDGSGIVNFFDYAVIAGAWRTVSGDVNYVPECDLEHNRQY